MSQASGITPRDASGAVLPPNTHPPNTPTQHTPTYTHTQDASAAYLLALTHLISHPGDAPGAVAAAEAWAAAHAAKEVVGWLAEAAAPGPGPAVVEAAGWLRWGLVYTFR